MTDQLIRNVINKNLTYEKILVTINESDQKFLQNMEHQRKEASRLLKKLREEIFNAKS